MKIKNSNIKTNNNNIKVKPCKQAFTFVELIIVMMIIVILSAIWFVQYISHVATARDTQRKSDIWQINSALNLYKQNRSNYWYPWNYFNITYSGTTVALQWFINQNVRIDSLDQLPLDPKTWWYYSFSVTNNKQEFLIAWTLENNKVNEAIVNWNYKSISKNILPTILIATWATEGSDVEIMSWTTDWDIHRKLFIYNWQAHNLPYTFTYPYPTYNDWTSFETLLTEVENNDLFWQNSDFRNCTEIEEAWKLIIPLSATSFEYQIVSETWALVNTWCVE